MDVYLFSILFILAIVLLLLTFFKKQIIIGIFTGIYFILMGVVLWNGISYVSSTTITNSGDTYNITNVYSDWSNPVFGDFSDNELVGTGFVLFGLFIFLVSMVMVFTGKQTLDIDNDSEFNDGEGG